MSEMVDVVSPSALKELQELNTSLATTIKLTKEVNANMINVKTPSGSDGAIKKLTADYDAQRATIQKLQQQLNSLVVTQKAVTTSGASVGKATREQSVAQQILRAETDRSIRANTLLGGAYAKASAQLLILKKQAKDYAIALGETHPRTLQAVKDANDLGGRIKSADQVVGDFQRNVGNYSNAFTKGFASMFSSVRQLAYILPGIGIAGIFGLALDPLFEYIKGLKIVQDTFGLETEAIKKSKEALIEKSQAEDQARTKLAEYQSDEISRSKILFENAKNLDLPYKKRLEAVTELQTRYPEYLGNLSKEQILAGDTAIAEDKLNDALVRRGIALASQQLIQEEINNSLKNEKWISDKLNDIQKQRLDLAGKLNKIDPFTKDEAQRKRYEDLSLQLERLYYLEGTLKDQYKSKNEKIQESIKFYIEQYNANAKYIGIVKDGKKADDDANKSKEEKNKIDLDSIKALEDTIIALKKVRSETSLVSTNYEILGAELQLLETIHSGLVDSMKQGQEEVIKGIELTEEQVYYEYFAWLKLKDATDEYIRTLTSGYVEKGLDSIGLSSAKMFLDFDENGQSTFNKLLEGADTLKEKFAVTFQAIGDIAQDSFNKIIELSNQSFENEYNNLAKQKEIALMFAGESATAREEIERQYEAKQKEIKRREFQAKKQQAIFNIAIDTAQALVAQLAATPLPFGTGFLAIIAAIGAAQIALVASQQVPSYWKGTENHQGGWMKINDRNLGQELVITPDGKHTIYEGKDVMVNAPKGTKVKTAKETMDYLMFNNDLNNILTSNSIGSPIIEVKNDGISDSQVNKIVSAIKDKPVFGQRISNGQLRDYIHNGSQEKEIMNKRVNFIPRNV